MWIGAARPGRPGKGPGGSLRRGWNSQEQRPPEPCLATCPESLGRSVCLSGRGQPVLKGTEQAPRSPAPLAAGTSLWGSQGSSPPPPPVPDPSSSHATTQHTALSLFEGLSDTPIYRGLPFFGELTEVSRCLAYFWGVGFMSVSLFSSSLPAASLGFRPEYPVGIERRVQNERLFEPGRISEKIPFV